MPHFEADQLINWFLGGLAALLGLVWFTLRLYIKDQLNGHIEGLKDWMVETFVSKEIHELKDRGYEEKFQIVTREIETIRRKNGSHQ